MRRSGLLRLRVMMLMVVILHLLLITVVLRGMRGTVLRWKMMAVVVQLLLLLLVILLLLSSWQHVDIHVYVQKGLVLIGVSIIPLMIVILVVRVNV